MSWRGEGRGQGAEHEDDPRDLEDIFYTNREVQRGCR